MWGGRRISIAAIILGSVVNIGCQLIIGFIASIAMSIVIEVGGVRPAAAVDAKLQEWSQSTTYGIVAVIVGFAFTTFGGFVAGWMGGRHSAILNGAIVGLTHVLFLLPFMDDFLAWYNIAFFIGSVPFGMLGGRFAGWSITGLSMTSPDQTSA